MNETGKEKSLGKDMKEIKLRNKSYKVQMCRYGFYPDFCGGVLHAPTSRKGFWDAALIQIELKGFIISWYHTRETLLDKSFRMIFRHNLHKLIKKVVEYEEIRHEKINRKCIG